MQLDPSRSSYVPKTDDHMHKVLIRKCPTCGAAVGDLCVTKSGRKVTKAVNVHTARFNDARLSKRSTPRSYL
jgi:hypothetical protein